MRQLSEADTEHQYGRPIAYYQQLQELNLMEAWSKVRVPLLALHGQCDWIMSGEDLVLMADLVNRNSPGSARFMELPPTGHTLEHYESQAAAFAGEPQPFPERIAALIAAWFSEHR
jgi:pimeloyl-ACP methyl ester carboxylesterase